MRLLRFVRMMLVVSLVLLLSSCASAPPTAAPRVPSGAQAAWVTSLLGVPPDASLFVRPLAARTDAYWGPLLSRVLLGPDKPDDFISHGSGMMVLNAQQIDLHIAVRDPIKFQSNDKGNLDPRVVGWVGVIHGIVPLDPLALRTGGGKPLFAPAWRMPSGVLMFPPDQAYAAQFGLFAPTLFVFPDWTCIVTEAVTAARARDLLANSSVPSLRLDAAPDSLAGIVANITSIQFLSAGKRDRASIFQNTVAAGAGLKGGGAGAVDAYADYLSADDARRGYVALERTCAEKPKECDIGNGIFKDAKAIQDGRRIAVSLAFSDATLQSLRTWQP
jgi:hypothetical protein